MKTRAAGFTLVEVVIALAIFASVGVALIGLLGTGLNVSRDVLADAEVTMLIENVQARMTLDPEWPGDRDALFYDNSGADVSDEASAAFRVTFKPIAGPGFDSEYFDTLRVAIESVPQKRSVATWMLQRARLAQGKPQSRP